MNLQLTEIDFSSSLNINTLFTQNPYFNLCKFMEDNRLICADESTDFQSVMK